VGGFQSHYMTKEQRNNAMAALWEMSQLCGICKKQLPGRRNKATTLDHVIPTSRGGTDDLTNLQLAHYKCNNIKANRLPGEFTL
jgi:5-methylcytosine-specific restriction endonuclease McrA